MSTLASTNTTTKGDGQLSTWRSQHYAGNPYVVDTIKWKSKKVLSIWFTCWCWWQHQKRSACHAALLSFSLLRLVLLATMGHVLFWSVIWLVWQLRYCCHCHRRCRPSRYCAVETIHPPWWTPGRRLCPRAHPPRSKLDSVY